MEISHDRKPTPKIQQNADKTVQKLPQIFVDFDQILPQNKILETLAKNLCVTLLRVTLRAT